MVDPDGPGGFGGPSVGDFGGMPLFGHLAGLIGGLVIIAAIVLLVVLLVRFLLVATRAAKVYVERNGTSTTKQDPPD